MPIAPNRPPWRRPWALALARVEPLIVEAGTGTGKTFAYLVPALLSGRSVIISTGTRTLQDQLFRRDVPLLGARRWGMPVKIALLKGRANYLCRHRLELAMQQRLPCAARARIGRHARARVSLGGHHRIRRSGGADRPAGAVARLADDHLDPRELPGPGVSAVLALPCVRARAAPPRPPTSWW